MAKTAATARRTRTDNDWLTEAIARGAEQPFSEIVEIGPALAAALLERNTANRNFNPGNVGTIERDLREGRWQFNGESIVVTREGELNDGQHRLEAVVRAGRPIRSVVVFGVERESRLTLDTGRHRDAADNLHFAGIKNATTTAAVARLVIAWERSDGRHFHDSKHVSISQQVERALADPAIVEAGAFGNRLYYQAHKLLSGTHIGFCKVVLGRIDQGAAETYLTQVCGGENLSRTDAAFVVRNRLFNEDRRSRDVRIGMALRGWAFFRSGETPAPAAIVGGSPMPELAP